MKTKLSFASKRRISHLKGVLLPTRLFYRFLLIIFVPMFLVQAIGLYIFFDRHLYNIHRRLAFAVASEVDIALELTSNTDFSSLILDKISAETGLVLSYINGDEFSIESDKNISSATTETFNHKFKLGEYRIKRDIDETFLLEVKNSNGKIIHASIPYKRLYSSTFHIFILWNIGLSILFLSMAVVFMKNQIRPINKLASAADDFGKGAKNKKYLKISGAKEVRQASSAFLKMRDRITKQIDQRTDMLSGISHDLRTPLTRMKLELAMIENQKEHKHLIKDIEEMEEMLQGYIAFAKGEQEEQIKTVDFNLYLKEIVKTETKHHKKGSVDLHLEQNIETNIKPKAFKRALANIISNGCKYANNIWITAGIRGDYIEIMIDDNGKGNPKESREDAFKPFVRMEKSRNKKTGGIGLGLSVARDIINSHGGSIYLNDSPHKGLRVTIKIPK